MNKRKFKVGELYRVGRDRYFTHTESGDVIKILEVGFVCGYETALCEIVKPADKSHRHYTFNLSSSFANNLKKISSDIDREIQITFHGKTTVAKLKEYGKVVKVGVSKCCPDDTYKESLGAAYALARVYCPNFIPNNEVKKEQRRKT